MEILDFDGLVSAIKEIIDYRRKAMIAFHSMGDTDSISSSIALSSCMPNSIISAPDQITSNSKRIMGDLGFDEDMISREFDNSSDIIILVDVNNFDGCGSFREALENFGGDVIIIDHHLLTQINKERIRVFNDEGYSSTAGIVYDLLKRLKVQIDKSMARLLLIGILSDSAELKNSSYKTFIQIGELLQVAGTDYSTLIEEMKNIGAVEQREEIIEHLFASTITKENGLLLIYGRVASHANIVADMAIRCDADIALFYSISKSEISFSARMRPPLDARFDIHLGKIMRRIAHIINGTGGGHPCAAGAYGNNRSEQAAIEFIDAFRKEIKTLKG